MKTILLFIVSAVGICLPQSILGQGTTYVSTLPGTPIGSAAIGADSWNAQMFITGPNAGGYALDSIQLLMNAATASPSGFSVSVYSKTGDPHSASDRDSPQNSLGSLAGADPAAGGLFTYSASSLELSPSTFYFVVATAASPISQGAYNWSAVDSFGRLTIGGDGWYIPDSYYSSVNGSSWTSTIRQDIFQLAINGRPVPEPSAFALCAAALALWILRQRR